MIFIITLYSNNCRAFVCQAVVKMFPMWHELCIIGASLHPLTLSLPDCYVSETRCLSSFLASIHPAVLFLFHCISLWSQHFNDFLQPWILHHFLSPPQLLSFFPLGLSPFHLLSSSLSAPSSHPAVPNFCFSFCQSCQSHLPSLCFFLSFHLPCPLSGRQSS